MGDDWRDKKEARHYRNLYTHLRKTHGFSARTLQAVGSAEWRLRMLHLIDHAVHLQDHFHKANVL